MTYGITPEVRATLEPLINLTNAYAWDGETDKWMFAHDLIEDETNLTATDRLVAYLEGAFDNLLEAHHDETRN